MKNLIIAYRKCEPQSVIDGLAWYRTANEFCRTIADKYNQPIDKVCAVLSALSPATNYEQNKKDTEAFFALKTGRLKAHKFTTYGQNVIKAHKIFAAIENYLQFFSLKTGPKTYNFYLNVLNPLGNEVTIDRHAYRIATGLEYKGLTIKQYNLIADAYRRSARALGVLPLELQAVLWIDYRIKQEIAFKKYESDNCPF